MADANDASMTGMMSDYYEQAAAAGGAEGLARRVVQFAVAVLPPVSSTLPMGSTVAVAMPRTVAMLPVAVTIPAPCACALIVRSISSALSANNALEMKRTLMLEGIQQAANDFQSRTSSVP